MWKLVLLFYWSDGDNFFLAEGWIVHAQKQTSAWPRSTATKINWNQTLAQSSPCLLCWKSQNNTQKLIKHLQYTNCSDWEIWNYLKLVFYLAGIGLWIQSTDVVIYGSELTDWNGCVATETCLQNGIMDKHVLLLHRGGDIKITFLIQIMKYHSSFFLKSCPICIFGSVSRGDKLHSVLCDSFVSIFHPSSNVRSHVLISDLRGKWGAGTLRNVGQNGGGLRKTSGCKACLSTGKWSGMDLQ